VTRLLLIRHGQSTWNALGRWQGQEDPPLTDLGRRQAAEASAAIGAVDAVFSSTLERARVTAEIIAEQIGVGPVVSLPDLIERRAGEWEGMTRAEIEEQYPGFLEAGHRPPNWEADEVLGDRAMSAFGQIVLGLGSDLVASGEERGDVDVDAIVVTHGGLVYEVERRLGAPFERMANLGARWIELRRGVWHLGDRVDLLHGIDVTIPDQI
jgi:probable phosphoglycerate mutase